MVRGPVNREPARLDASSLLALAMVLALASGCGAPEGRQAISGVVTLDGHPLDDGAILLEPFDPNLGVMSVGATIRRGAFAIGRDRGPTPGSYRVRIYSSSGVQNPPARGQTERSRRPMVERVPEVYNTRSTLRLDVVDGGRNHWRLELHGEGGTEPDPGGSTR